MAEAGKADAASAFARSPRIFRFRGSKSRPQTHTCRVLLSSPTAYDVLTLLFSPVTPNTQFVNSPITARDVYCLSLTTTPARAHCIERLHATPPDVVCDIRQCVPTTA
ncbi:hypothetical protein BD626DRAFT_539299 [Schizophyllum amplum]|uniref:Uncharacterized protein n=1 Tax=Schizophyllum amplum TaxID=97359 RepID=A0A550C463_9AGAR|nr:hypothetical protein BD626DRAFT_539299 [Auriculariopsis ampla]